MKQHALEESLVYDNRKDFESRQVIRNKTIHVDAPLDEAFPLFTPLYESQWLPVFQPRFITPPEPQRAGMVFLTDHKDPAIEEPMLWVMSRYESAEGRAEYTRFAPYSDVTTIRIHAERAGDRATDVHVTYELTGLTNRGNAVIDSMDEAFFEKWLGGWEIAVNEYLANKRT